MLYIILLLSVIAADKVQSEFCGIGNKDACRATYTFEYFNGSVVSADQDTMCSCRGKTCHTSWRRINFMIRVRLFSDVANATAKYMFCDRFSLPTCATGSTAVIMSGMPHPRSIQTINCKCSDNNPMFYKSSTWGANFQRHHSYICDSHKTMCDGENSICASTSELTTTYNCECPTGYACRTDPNSEEVDVARCRAI